MTISAEQHLSPTAVVEQWRTDAEQHGLMFVVMYCRPSDSPDHWVLRAQYSGGAGGVVASRYALKCRDERQARTMLRVFLPDLVQISRSPDDDPAIVATWM